jgi:hypothetical protein
LRWPDAYLAVLGERLIDAHLSGQRTTTLELHKLLSLHFVERTFLKS